MLVKRNTTSEHLRHGSSASQVLQVAKVLAARRGHSPASCPTPPLRCRRARLLGARHITAQTSSQTAEWLVEHRLLPPFQVFVFKAQTLHRQSQLGARRQGAMDGGAKSMLRALLSQAQNRERERPKTLERTTSVVWVPTRGSTPIIHVPAVYRAPTDVQSGG